jgi:hypothetical protein
VLTATNGESKNCLTGMTADKGNASIVLGGDALRKGQSQTGALVFAFADKGVEERGSYAGRYPFAII